MTPHLLLTAWAFPPARTSGVYRALGIANAFAAAGWRVTVLCGPAQLFRSNLVVDESLVAAVHRSVRIVEVPLEHHELSTDIGTWGRMRARYPELWAKLRLRRDHREFPEAWFGSWAPALRRAAERVHAAEPVTLSIGTAGPSVDFVSGEHLHRIAGVPYVLDYRDAWTIDVYTGEDASRVPAAAGAREASLMAAAHEVWFVNDPIRRWHAHKYPETAARMRTVRNGFDLPVGSEDRLALGVRRREGADAAPPTFGYIGTINHGAFPMHDVVAGWTAAVPTLPPGSRLVLRGHLGRTGEGSPELLAELAAAAAVGVVYEGPVPRSGVHDVYSGFDALVLALVSGPGVTSGKVYEYAATGLPIVSVHTPETPVGEVLGASRHWHPAASLDPADVAAAFIAAAEDAASTDQAARDAAIRWGARWSREAQLAQVVEELSAEFGGAA